MTNRSFVVIVILIFVVFISLVFSIGIHYFDWFNLKEKNSYVKYIPSEKQQVNVNTVKNKDITTDTEKILQKKEILKEKKIVENKIIQDKISEKKFENKKIKKIIDITTDTYVKDLNLPNQNFHSFGEYISQEESRYRISLIKNLKIKTIIINSLTKNNGVTQEFYRIVYSTKMIPAKILDQIVESKEFRDLIPKKYLSKEVEFGGLKKGEYIKFKNTDIKNILIQWTQGRLTPIQKAWEVKAEK
ncbi:MAG: hypothetical protein A2086_04870 [Spirochaetes bacterium GWD1_27_9]|nr:MAG: hypothetical protein A2Z98_04285 [Spirochaetes bacterium GWB1_27_13]OHD27638.1 MAG: hypothetical protein A2Y34_00325 [Spirochaetes bacterium GWC1_27_15]OHD31948.1 MAG: hypothetical protein A2086_04870 [Spirochaetes bacterium GWD1_27_9]